MELKLEVKRCPVADRAYWIPFDLHVGFNTQWWTKPTQVASYGDTYLSVTDGAEEVARIEIAERVHLGDYVRGSRFTTPPLLIALIEVEASRRGHGIGGAAVQLLAARFPHRTLVAFSEEADAFWESLGWMRYTRQGDNETRPRSQPLYVQPNCEDL